MANVTSYEHVLSVLGTDDTAKAEQAYLAAEAAVSKRCRWSGDAAPDDLVQAVVLRTARLLARHNSPDGIVGVSEFGPVRVASVDRDITDLEGPYRRVVFG